MRTQPKRTGAYIVKSADGRSGIPPKPYPVELFGVEYRDRIELAAAVRQAHRVIDSGRVGYHESEIRGAREFITAAKPYVRGF